MWNCHCRCNALCMYIQCNKRKWGCIILELSTLPSWLSARSLSHTVVAVAFTQSVHTVCEGVTPTPPPLREACGCGVFYSDLSKVMAMCTKKSEGRLMLPLLLPHFNIFFIVYWLYCQRKWLLKYNALLREPSRNDAKKRKELSIWSWSPPWSPSLISMKMVRRLLLSLMLTVFFSLFGSDLMLLALNHPFFPVEFTVV